MAIKLNTEKVIRNIAATMNIGIAILIAYGFWMFLSRNGIYKDPSWLVWIPFLILFLIGPPLFTTWTLFSDSSKKLRVIFFIINLLGLIFTLVGSYAHNWMMTTSDVPFSWHSVSKLFLILSTPFLINVMTLLYIMTRNVHH